MLPRPSGPRAGVQQSFLLRSCAGVDEGAVEEAVPPVQWGACGLRTVGVGLGQACPQPCVTVSSNVTREGWPESGKLVGEGYHEYILLV